ncbi:MAG: energy transducer TonB [Blastocatellales bacterium]
MNAFPTAIAAAMLIGGAAQDPALESKVVARVQQTPVSQYDSALPARPFGNWFNQIVGPQSGVAWSLTECIEQAGAASGAEQDIPACVEATAILPNERKVVAQILVGSFRLGSLALSPETKFHLAVIEDGDQFRSVQRLGALPRLLRAPFPTPRVKTIALPGGQTTKSPRLHIAGSPALIAPPKTMSVGVGEETFPPKPGDGFRVSKGVSVGETVTRVTPIYPSSARQINASGEVQVEIVIDETGRVIEAKAVSGNPMLRLSAEEAAMKWVFKPTLLDGKPVRHQGTLIFVFTL